MENDNNDNNKNTKPDEEHWNLLLLVEVFPFEFHQVYDIIAQHEGWIRL